MEEKASLTDSMMEKLEEYGRTNFELIRLKSLDKTTDCLSSAASRSFALLSFFIFILFASIGLALWLGELLGNSWCGFVCVAGLYGAVGFVLFFLAHNPIKKAISNILIVKLLN